MPLREIFKYRQARGFSLLEVLIAVVVLSIGLLGLAGLQFTALRGNSQSYERSQAHILAYEMADLMRANRIAAGQGAFEIDADENPEDPEIFCDEDACNREESAAYILDQWHRRLRDILPSGTARIACSVSPCTVGAMQTVSVIWDEDRAGSTDASCPAPADIDPDEPTLACVQVSLAP